MSRKILEGLWKAEKEKIKGNLPQTKVSFKHLQSNSVIRLTNQEESVVLEKDLLYLKEIIPEPLEAKLKLPFIFQKQKDVYRLLGDTLEKWSVEKMLGLTDISPYFLELFTPCPYYLQYHYKRIQKKLPSLTFLTYRLID